MRRSLGGLGEVLGGLGVVLGGLEGWGNVAADYPERLNNSEIVYIWDL